MPREAGEDVVKDLTDNASYDRLQKELESVKADISSLASQIGTALNDLTGNAQRQARRTFRQAKANIDGVVSDMSKHGSAALDAAQETAATLEDSLEEAITQRPLAAVGVALGLGLLIGMTWRR